MDLSGKSWPQLLVTEYLPGIEYSVDAFMGQKGGVAVARRRDQIRSGISFRTTIEIREDLGKYTLAAAKILCLNYAFGFQFKLSLDKTPCVLECNPRVQGTMVASSLAGVNCVWLAVQEALGHEPDPSSSNAQDGYSFIRYWGGIGHNINNYFKGIAKV